MLPAYPVSGVATAKAAVATMRGIRCLFILLSFLPRASAATGFVTLSRAFRFEQQISVTYFWHGNGQAVLRHGPGRSTGDERRD